MINNRKGISLIALIITIAIIVIIATVTIQNGLQRTDDAKLAKHNTNISITQEELESYYYYTGGDLPVIDLTPYNIVPNTTLYEEIAKNGEQTDDFYILNLSKLGKASGKDGAGIGDDIYIVSKTKHNVYYVRGTTVKRLIYHGLIKGNSGSIAQGQSLTPTVASTPTTGATFTPTNSPTPTSTPTPAPGSGYFDGMINSPKLSAGMIPISYTGSGNTYVDLNVSEQLNLNNEWYDYRSTGATANKWANVRLKDGSIFVWIPRYTYQVGAGEHTSTGGTINIRFSNGTTDNSTGGYKIHPAFYWGGWNIPRSASMTRQAGGTEITGFWVSKFEASNNSTKIAIKPNVASWRGLYAKDIFTKCQEMSLDTETYGITTSSDTHMMKNSEWGAVVYLSKWALGTTEITVNSNASYITAGGNIVTYKTQSTTRTEYGIFDMSGGSNEYMASYLNNGHSSLNTYGSSLITSDAKYKDVLPVGTTDSLTNNYNASNYAYGFALYETSSQSGIIYAWFSDTGSFPYSDSPFLLRGGIYNSAAGAGLFNFSQHDGWASINTVSFRPTLVVVP